MKKKKRKRKRTREEDIQFIAHVGIDGPCQISVGLVARFFIGQP